MITIKKLVIAICVVGAVYSPASADTPAEAKEALKPFNVLIGAWRGAALPSSRAEKKRGFWLETVSWGWKFKNKVPSIVVEFEKGRHYTKGELRYLADKKQYELTMHTTGKEKLVFVGKLKDKKLTVERRTKTQKHRLIFTLLHVNRFLYTYATCDIDRTLFRKHYLVGATRKGVAFAKGGGGPVCIVSGGLGVIEVTHKGKKYFVCCSGCQAEFLVNPEFYIKEASKKKKKK